MSIMKPKGMRNHSPSGSSPPAPKSPSVNKDATRSGPAKSHSLGPRTA